MEQWQDRIERKIDQLSDAVVSLARMEERMITLFKRMDAYDDRQTELSEKIADIDKQMTKRSVIYGIVDRAGWVAVAAGITALVTGVL